MRSNGRAFKRIYAIGQRLSRFGLCACFPGSRRRRRRRCLGSSCSGPDPQSALIIEKRFARGANLNGRLGRSDIDGKSREGSGERVGRRANQFIAKCGDSLREIEEWSVLGNRDIDGPTREVAGELMGSSESKRLLVGTARRIGNSQRGKARTFATRV